MNKKQSKDKPFLNLLLNIVIPVIILTKFSDESELGPLWGLIIALAFPVGYGIFDFIKEKKTNVLSVLGLISVLITGVIGLLELNARWIAIKEAAIPFVIGLIVIISTRSSYPLIEKLLFNESVINKDLIDQRLEEEDKKNEFAIKLKKASYWMGVSFFFSAVLNFILATIIVKSPSGTVAFNEEIGRMTAYSFPVIALPSTILLMIILFYLFRMVKSLTGLKDEEIIKGK